MIRPLRVLAAVDDSICAAPVLRAAGLIGGALGLPTTALYVSEPDDHAVHVRASAAEAGMPLRLVDGDPVDRIAEAFARAGTIGVLGARARQDDPRPAGGVAASVITAVTTPVVVVGPRTTAPRHRVLSRLVVPLDGTTETPDSVAPLVRLFVGAGLDVVLCHVFDRTTTPSFWDQPQHESRSWAEEFRTRWEGDSGGDSGAGVRCSSGEAADEILSAVDAEDGDLLMVAWARDVSGDRAAVVKALLAESRVPIVLVPRAQSSTEQMHHRHGDQHRAAALSSHV
ncbi:MAG TPA: universal stress protein [Actinomycetales bacterium]|nr:universal stress protein [Actinomycetales bacterium]